MALYVKIVRLLDLRLFGWRLLGNLGKVRGNSNNQTLKVFSSIHTPSGAVKVAFDRAVLNWAVEPCYWLPVSGANWRSFKTRYPKARGEVFFNPVRIGEGAELEKRVGVGGRELEKRVGGRERELERRVGVGGEELELNNPTIQQSNNPTISNQTIKQSNNFIVGMVGRNADQKDWPSFHKVEELVKGQFSGCLISDSLIEGAGKSNNPKSNNQTIPSVEFLNAGEHSLCDGRAAIRKMDLFLMTSKHEELPTTVLECFMERTPICGFIPRGGMEDILELSNGPLREVFIKERDCGKLADIVMDLLAHPKKRQALVEDGWQILEGHFDAEKNVRGRLMEIYKNCLIV